MLRRNAPHDVHDQFSSRTSNHYSSGSNYEGFYPQPQTQPLRLAKVPKGPRKAPERPPSIPPLFFEPNSGLYSPSLEEECSTPLPSAGLKRSSHIRRKEGPRRQNDERPLSRRALRIVTEPPLRPDSSLRLSQQSTPPLSPTRSMSPLSPNSAIVSASFSPSPQDTHMRCDSPENWPDSPGSTYSDSSIGHSHSAFVEWDSTGFLRPQGELHDVSEEDDKPEARGGLLTRQGTQHIVDLLRARRRRAGQD